MSAEPVTTPQAWPQDPVEEVAEEVLAVPGVAGLTAGPFGDLSTYLPGRRVPGVRRRGGLLEIAVVLAWGASADLVGRLIRARLGTLPALVEDRVEVLVVDVQAPEADPA